MKKLEAGSMVLPGLVAGLILALADLAFGYLHEGGVSQPSMPDRIGAVALLPGLGALAGYLVGWWRGLFGALVPAALAGWIGVVSARGNAASAMFLAAYWGPALAALTLAASWFRGRLANLERFQLVSSLVLVGGASGLYASAAFVERGRYEVLRWSVCCLAGVFIFALIREPLARASVRLGLQGGRMIRALALIAVLGGAFSAVRNDEAAAWAIDRGTAVTGFVTELRMRLLDDVAPRKAIRLEIPPFFGTPLAQASSERLGKIDGVLLITVDAMRFDLPGSLVGGRNVTPVIDELAKTGFRFERASAPAPSSMFSIFSIFSGRYPSQVVSHEGGFDGVPLVTTRLREHGVETRGCYTNGVMTRRTPNFERDDLDFEHATLHGRVDPPIEEIYEELRPSGPEARWFSYLHLFQPHHPYESARPEFRAGDGEFERYASEVRQSDDVIGKLLERFRESGHLDRMLVIVSADHGEEFKEHGGSRHGGQVWEVVTRVPLVVSGPGVARNSCRHAVSLIDLAPTLEQVFELPDEGRPEYVGRSLIPLAVGLEDPDRLDHVITESLSIGAGMKEARVGIAGPRWKLIVDERLRRRYLFDLQADPAEKHDLIAEHEDVAEDLVARIWATRRIVGHLRDDLFDEIDSATQIIKHGEDLEPNDLYSHIRRGPAIPDKVLARHLVELGLGGHAVLLSGIIAAMTDSAGPKIRHAVRLARAAALHDEDEFDRLIGEIDTIFDPSVFGGLFIVASRKRDPRLLDIKVPARLAPTAPVKVGVALYRLLVANEFPSRELLIELLRGDDAYAKRRACDLIRMIKPADLYDELVAIDAAEESRKTRTAIISAISEIDDPRRVELLGRRLREAEGMEQAQAMHGLALLGADEDRRVVLPYADPKTRERTSGLRPVDQFFGEFTGRKATIPIHLFPEGTRFGIYVQIVGQAHVWPDVRLEIGEWSTVLERRAAKTRLPIVLTLPAGLTGDQARLSLMKGRPSNIRFAGTISLPK